MKHLMAALASGGWLLAIVVGVLSFVGGDTVNPDIVEEVREEVTRSPLAFECYDGWTSQKGFDRDSGEDFITCTSPEGRYVVRSTGGAEPTQAFDTETGEYVDVSRFR